MSKLQENAGLMFLLFIDMVRQYDRACNITLEQATHVNRIHNRPETD